MKSNAYLLLEISPLTSGKSVDMPKFLAGDPSKPKKDT